MNKKKKPAAVAQKTCGGHHQPINTAQVVEDLDGWEPSRDELNLAIVSSPTYRSLQDMRDKLDQRQSKLRQEIREALIKQHLNKAKSEESENS